MNNAFNSTMDSCRGLTLSAGDLHEVAGYARQQQRSLDRIERARIEGDEKDAKHFSKQHLKSFSAKVGTHV